ncbi:MAG: hypothetical protein JWN44_6461 [Myxococcales bacterium]|nr:hypothetical protein [Myxococcales bacterium]
MRRIAGVMLLFALAGCPQPPAPPEPPDLARPVKVEKVAPPTPTPMPTMAEVEVAGVVDNRAAFKGDVLAWITDAPCWQPATKSFGSSKTQPNGAFFMEVFVPQGTSLWVCAATADGSASGSDDKAPLAGKGLGEITYPGQHLTLKKGKRVTAPPPAVPLPPLPKK